MRKIEEAEFKKLTYDMLAAFSELCDAEGLRYILDYGTLLGAVRHDGFIPWDDDIDVSMPRADYEKLYEKMTANPEKMGGGFRLSSYRNEYNVQKPCFNIIDTRTITKSPNRIPKYYYPVWIDVFPMDYLSGDRTQDEKRIAKCLKMLHLCQVAYNPGGGSLRKIKRCIYSLQMPFLQGRLEKIDSVWKEVDHSVGSLTNYMGPYGLRDISDISFYDDVILHKFEGGEFRIPRDYDKRLSNLYGDYMTPPPKDKRIPHVTDAYWRD